MGVLGRGAQGRITQSLCGAVLILKLPEGELGGSNCFESSMRLLQVMQGYVSVCCSEKTVDR